MGLARAGLHRPSHQDRPIELQLERAVLAQRRLLPSRLRLDRPRESDGSSAPLELADI